MHGTASGEATVPVSSVGGLVALAPPESLPEGASPRTYNTDFNVGQARTRDGLTHVYNQSTGSLGPNNGAAVSSTWNSPNALLSSSAGYASFAPVFQENNADVTQFSFAIPSGDTIIGIQVGVQSYGSAPVVLIADLISGSTVLATKRVTLSTAPSPVTFGGSSDLWGKGWSPNTINAVGFGVRLVFETADGFTGATGFAQNVQLTVWVNTGQQTMQPFGTFTNQNGLRYNLVLDQGGNLWVEALDNAPNVLTLSRSGIAPGSMAVTVQGEGVEYMAFVKPLAAGGADMPLQWTPSYQDRITQVGPGTPPVFTPSQASDQDYGVSSITQPAAQSRTSSYFLQSAGPGSQEPGNVVTFYYSDSTLAGPDTDLVNAFNSGYPVYLYASFTGTPSTFGPQVVLVTSVGEAQPPAQPRNFYYFCFQVDSVAYTFYPGSGNPGYTANYQRSLATLTSTVPVPNLLVSDTFVISGASPSNWNSTWTVEQTPNASEMVITGSQVTAGVATFNYAVTNGTSPPAAGELVTITNTLNAGGQLNVTQATIATATGGNTGSFTVAGYPGTLTAAFEAENGYADTAGTIFDFDPGASLVGTSTNPIYGNAGAGGDIVFNASGVYIDPGTYQGTVFFILRDGSYTFPAPPVVFTVPENTTQLVVTQLVIGPPNVYGRGIAITEAGQNGVPGANFFTLPNAVSFYVDGVKQTATSFFVRDNTSISAKLFFTSDVLNNALAIDTYGYNLFNLIEIGDPAWISAYDSRNVYGQPLNKVQNLLNMSFDGGFVQSTVPVPAGWSQPQYGSLTVSPIFGNSYYIKNTTSSTLTQAGLIQQSAYQDANNEPILNPNTGYSVRATVRCPSGITGSGGSLVVALQAGSAVLGSFALPLSSLTTSYARFIGVLLADPGLASIPANLQLQVYGSDLPAGADIEIDRIEVFESDIPVLLTTEYWSYAGLPTMVDGVTGEVLYQSENQQPVQGATVLYDTHYVFKGWLGTSPGSSLYSLQASASLEPADWDEPEVSQRSGGAVGPLAWAAGEQWLVAASRPGIYLFVGGQPGKIMQEIQPIWDAINWNAGGSIWLDVNLKARRLLCGVPLPTPNFWLPNAPVNAAPTSPNVVLMLNFQGLDSGEALRGEPQMHTTMFGTLAAIDMRRKWSLWTMESPYATTVQGTADEQTRFGNGQGNSQVYYLDSTQNASDDGEAIDSLYTTSGHPLLSKRQELPQLGPNRVCWTFINPALISGGTVNLRLLGDFLYFPEPTGYNALTVPGGFAPSLQPTYQTQGSLNFIATRTFFEFRQNDGNQGWTLSNIMLRARKAVWSAVLGFK